MKTRLYKKAYFIAHTIKASLAMVIPVLFIGSFMVMLNGFPILPFQEFLDSFLGGALRVIILTVQQTTVGILAAYITIALNFSYMNQTEKGQGLVFRFGSLLGCLNGFFILVGFFSGEPDITLLSGQGVFSAMVAGLVGSILFRKFENLFKTRKMVFVDGADSEFNSALHVILPYLCVTLCFAIANYLINVIFGVQSLQHLFMKAMEAIFIRMQRSYSSGLLFTTLTSTLWWFGIHGNNVLNQVSEDMFVAIIPGQIVSKSFIDTFVNMGGTGCTIGLLLAMAIFGKRASTKKLSGMALLPAVFNIGELMVFGFPIIYNPLMIAPFILSPVLCFTNAFVLTKIGFMPYVETTVVWTVPPLMSGFLATGSLKGLIVQLMNIIISMACYAPFVLMYEKRSLNEFAPAMSALIGEVRKTEETTEEVALTEREGTVGRFAKHLAMDIETSLDSLKLDEDAGSAENPMKVCYQTFYDDEGKCIGAEALLRWEHKQYGNVDPDLAIKIARESGDLFQLESYITERALSDAEYFRDRFGNDFIMNINVTLSTLRDERFAPFLQLIADRYKLKSGNICFEIKEESEPASPEEMSDIVQKIRLYGYTFAIDDFSMGHTSLQYLQNDRFDMVKLDEDLVRSVTDNERTKEIINSIVYLAKSLDIIVVAKYVENEEQKEALKEAGCSIYQGFLFAEPADPDAILGHAGRG